MPHIICRFNIVSIASTYFLLLLCCHEVYLLLSRRQHSVAIDRHQPISHTTGNIQLPTHRYSSTLPISAMSIMSPISVSCLRCTDLGFECLHHHAESLCCSKLVCNECDAAGLDSCVFPPSIRYHEKSKAACSSCSERHRKCIFLDDNDSKCTRCSKRGLNCGFEISGKQYVFRQYVYYLLIIYITSNNYYSY